MFEYYCLYVSQLYPNRYMSLAAFAKYVKFKGQVPTLGLFRYCFTLSGSLEGRKWVTWFYTFVRRRNQNPLNDIFKGKLVGKK